jgi:hypothetical protein
MAHRKLIAGAVAACVVASGATAGAASAAAPGTATIKAVTSLAVKVNRYIQDGTRWNKDVYTVKSGGKIHLVQKAISDGPHTFTVVAKKDLPKTAKQIINCKICGSLAKAHGADPNTEGPPQFQYLENGQGTNDAPGFDGAGDSAFFGAQKQGEALDLNVTAKKGTTLNFMCLVHPWMQAKVQVK